MKQGKSRCGGGAALELPGCACFQCWCGVAPQALGWTSSKGEEDLGSPGPPKWWEQGNSCHGRIQTVAPWYTLCCRSLSLSPGWTAARALENTWQELGCLCVLTLHPVVFILRPSPLLCLYGSTTWSKTNVLFQSKEWEEGLGIPPGHFHDDLWDPCTHQSLEQSPSAWTWLAGNVRLLWQFLSNLGWFSHIMQPVFPLLTHSSSKTLLPKDLS